MTILLPNYLQTGSYAAKKDRRVNSAEVVQEGIVRKGHFTVAQRGAGANMSVDVAAGEAWVKGDSAVDQGYYHVVNDATVNVGLTAANASNPRIDAIVLAVNDSTEVGGSDSYLLEAIAGTPTAGATLANLKGAPTPGATKLTLAYVLVGAAVTKIENASVGGLRAPRNFREEFLGMGAKVEPYAVAGAPPQYAHGRPLDYVPTSGVTISAQISPAIETEIAYNTENWDNDEMHSLVTNTGRLVASTPGFYLCGVSYACNAAVNMYISKNTAVPTSAPIGITTSIANGFGTTMGIVYLGFGDFVLTALLNGGSTLLKTDGTPQFSAIWQGP